MDDDRWTPGMPVLDRQPVRTPTARGVPQRVPETRPTPLRDQFIYLSAFAAVCGAIAITALELGAPLGSPIVKLCVLFGSPPLALAMADATLKIWRSAWAWLPVNRGRGLFRFAWVAASVTLIGLLIVSAALVLMA